MGALTASMKATVDELKAAGIRATADPRNLNLPCVIIGPPSIPELELSCGGTATQTAYVVGQAPGNLDTWKQIDDLAEKVGRVVDVEAVVPVQYQHDQNANALPALQLTWTQALTWPTPAA